MKLSEAITRVNKKDIEDCYEIEIFSRILGLDYYGYVTSIPQHLKCVYLTKWMCTDTWVGTRVYFLDDEPVAISYQSARKSDECVDFLSVEAANKMREFILSLMGQSETQIVVCDVNKEIEEFYQVSYGSQLLTDEGFYKDQPAKVIEKWQKYEDIDKWSKVRIRYQNGYGNTLEEIIDLVDFNIPINIVKE